MSVAESLSIYEVLEDLRSRGDQNRDMGTAFEDLVAKFLTSDPLYAPDYERVVPYAEFAPQGARKDLGIDLVGIRRDGGVTAIQCKFYAPHHPIAKKDIDSFLSESGKHPFTERLLVSTTDNWSSNAEDALANQQIPVTRIGLMELNDSAVEWHLIHELQKLQQLPLKPHKTPQPHQRAALEDVKSGFAQHSRGKLIMACGTGKTFTALKLVEELVPAGGRVLFLAPSIALVSQSLREWGNERSQPMRFFAVCSDASVGKRSKKAGVSEDISAHDMVIPATTNGTRLAQAAMLDLAGDEREPITVVFSTYQSIDVITEAQHQGLGEFDLIICDEAHRTTGSWANVGEQSAFTKVHDDENVAGAKRLYMTATPRVYGDTAKKTADEGAITIASMDDEALFGPEFHRLEFGTAVDQGLLTDYKVIVLNIAEDYASMALQNILADANYEIDLDDAAKLVGVWNALAKRSITQDFAGDDLPMRRAVAFAKSIRDSETVQRAFEEVSLTLSRDTDGRDLICQTEHVDGTQNALLRSERLAWLKADIPDPNTCRLLTNARCLSEGVDVPALDAVIFLNPRNSIVDVVQSVGRVMRRDPAGVKKLGYIIIPVAVPAGMEPDQALNNHARYKVVWDVLRALRSHDSRLEAEINTLDPTKPNDRIKTIGIGKGGDGSDRDASDPGQPKEIQGTFDLTEATAWREAVLARLVKNVGNRMYWDTWGREVADIVDRTSTRVRFLIANDPVAASEFTRFHEGLKGNLNDSITVDDAIGMLAQHMVTAPVFEALLGSYQFLEHNAVAQVMERMLRVLYANNLETEYASLEKFYGAVRERVRHIDDAGRMRFVNELYEKFFTLAFPKTADQLGIVYTPVEVVDFILRGVDELLREHFGSSLADEGVHILDPFTGTGTFIVRLIQSGLISREQLLRKYLAELHANEILLLAYYIAVINIESAFHGVMQGVRGLEPLNPMSEGGLEPPLDYVPFPGAILADTFQMTEDGDTLDTQVFTANNDRMQAQLALPIRVIVGNPPYSVGQGSQDDDAANLKYPTLDGKIADTYVKRSQTSLTKSLYNSYIRAIRWASDRISDRGIIGFVTNGGWLDANAADGMRKSHADEFDAIYVFNLRGNARTAGEQRRREAGSVFGEGARTTVAITFLVKTGTNPGPADIYYRDIGDYLSRDQKLTIVDESSVGSLDWQRITPNEAGDWINQRSDEFETFTPLGDKGDPGIFTTYSGGLKTNRDAWVYNFSSDELRGNVERTVTFYNELLDAGARQPVRDPHRISWDGTLEADFAKRKRAVINPTGFRTVSYRPFTKQQVYFDRMWNNSIYRMPSMFPTPNHPNVGIYNVGMGSAVPFTVVASNHMPDVHLTGAGSGGQFFSRYTYEPADEGVLDFGGDVADGYRRIDNITDATLTEYRAHYGEQVTKDDIFAFVYGLLHSPDYRERFAADLKRMLPRIPLLAAHQFEPFRAAGEDLLALHTGYEDAEPYPLTVDGIGPEPTDYESDAAYAFFRVDKMKYPKRGRDTDKTTIIYNSHITVRGIPEAAQRYMLGSRSGVDWVVDRYQVKTDKASGIVNDPNDWSREVGNPRYILDLIGKVTAVSVRTMEIVEGLPELRIVE